MTVCVRCHVSGRVQGVFFRASARHQAEQMGITGYARNLPDGRVELMACGESEAVERFRGWLAQGPEGARVTGVSCEVMPAQTFSGFDIG